MLFSAELFADAWRGVAAAYCEDADGPAELYRTVAIEMHPKGVRLVANDSYRLLHSFVPAKGQADELVDEPDIDEVPTSYVVAVDRHLRLDGLLKFAQKMAKAAEKDGSEAPELRVEILTQESGGQGTLDPTLLVRKVRFNLPAVGNLVGRSEETLETYDGTYTDWRRTVNKWEPNDTGHIGASKSSLAKLVKLADMSGREEFRIDTNGVLGGMKITLGRTNPIHGIIMPVRLEEDRDLPAPEDRAASSIGRFEAAMGWGDDSATEPGQAVDELDDAVLMRQAIEWVVTEQNGNEAALQRALKIGFAQAGRLVEWMKDLEIIGLDGDVWVEPAQLASILRECEADQERPIRAEVAA